jgi:hypothetical protein
MSFTVAATTGAEQITRANIAKSGFRAVEMTVDSSESFWKIRDEIKKEDR